MREENSFGGTVFLFTLESAGIAKAAEYAYDSKENLSAENFEFRQTWDFCEAAIQVFEHALKIGRDEGYQEGYQEGYRYGFAEGSGVDVSDLEEAGL